MTWNRCIVCSHAARRAIEKQIRGGASCKVVADRYGLVAEHVERHKAGHMIRSAPGTPENPEVENLPVVHSKMDPVAMFQAHDDLIDECRQLMAFGMEREDPKAWSMGIHELRCCLDQQNKILNLYDQVDPRLSKAFGQEIIDVVVRVLASFPDAQKAVVKAIEAKKSGDDD